MPELLSKEVVSSEDFPGGATDGDFQDDKSQSSQKQEANDDEAILKSARVSEVGSLSQRSCASTVADGGPDSTLPLQPTLLFNLGEGSSLSNETTAAEDAVDSQCCRRGHICGPANSQGAGSDVSTAENLILVGKCIHPIVADTSRNTMLAGKAEHLSNSSVMSYKIKKQEPPPIVPMLDLPAINDNFYPDGDPGFQGVNIRNGMIRTRPSYGYIGDSPEKLICIATAELDVPSGQGIKSSVDVYVSELDADGMRRFCEVGPEALEN